MNDTVAKARRRAKIVAIAKTGDYNAAEAAVAQSMLDKTPEGTLERLSERIKAAVRTSVDAQFEIGHLLTEAEAMFPAKTGGQPGVHGGARSPFRIWFETQGFGFGFETARRYREAAAREPEVRAFLSARPAKSGRFLPEMGVTRALQFMNATVQPLPMPTAPVDPAYAALRDAKNRIVGTDDEPVNAFLTMHVDDLAKSAGYLKAMVEAYQAAKAAR